jgi:plasmid stability protein
MTNTHHEKTTWKDRPRKDARLEFRVPADLLAALRTTAAAHDRTVAAEARRALRAHCEAAPE